MEPHQIIMRLQNARWRFSQIIECAPFVEVGKADAALIVRWAQDGLDDMQKLLDAQSPQVRADE